MKDKMKINGELEIVLRDENGNIKDTRKIKNLIVDTGLDWIAARLGGSPPTAMTHMAVGSGTTAADATDTDLESILGVREALDSTTPGTASIVYVSSFEAGEGTGAITEAGLFNASTAGTMLARTVFSVVNKAAGDTMGITWTVNLTAS